MNTGTLALIAIAIFVLTPLARIPLAALFGRSIGKAALDRQPDTIHLEAMVGSQFRQAVQIGQIADEYQQRGFEDAGSFTIPEMRGVYVRLLAHPGESQYATIYDHPVAGVFHDVVSRYADGSAWTFTTARATGLKHRDNVRMTNLPGTEPGALVDLARKERSQTGLCACSSGAAVRDFEAAYAEYIVWLKQRGISRGEVVAVARRKVA